MIPVSRLLQELVRRDSLLDTLFEKQRNAVQDPSPLRAWQCSRRAGKTTAAITEFFDDAQRHDFREYAYISLTTRSAQRIVWPILSKLARDHVPQAKLREHMFRVEMPNGSALTIYGADRPDWMDRLYGQSLAKIWIDEAAFFTVDLRYLIDEILEPCVADYRGSITLMSKPGYVLHGLFYDAVEGVEKGWSVSKWGWEDNPHMAPQVTELIKRRTDDNPEWANLSATRRNWFNEWVNMLGDRVYKFHSDRNTFSREEGGERRFDWLERPGDKYILGVDLGWNDPTAFVVGVYRQDSPRWIELESFSQAEMTIDQIVAQMRVYIDYYPGLRIVVDSSGAAKHVYEDMRARHKLPLIPAAKSDKRYWIEQYNNDMLAGRIKFVRPENSVHVEEMMDLTWDERPNGDLIERRGAPNNACDAALYAYRLAYHYRFVEKPAPPKPGTAAHRKKQEDAMERAAEKYFGAGGKLR